MGQSVLRVGRAMSVDLTAVVKAAQESTAEKYKQVLAGVMQIVEAHVPDQYPAIRAEVLALVQSYRR